MSGGDRARDRELDKAVGARAKTVLQTGLAAQPSRVDLLALARTLAQVMDRPAALAERLHDVFERSARPGAPTARLACKKGCAYCCHGKVTITAPEAFTLAARVKAGGAEAVAAFRERAAPVAGKSARERLGAKLPCPLLKEGACGVYAVRPLACRRVIAFDLTPCLEEFEGQDGEIAVPAHYTVHAANALIALAAAMKTSGRTLAHYEFSAAVLAILDAPDAEARWRRGEDVLTGVPTDDSSDEVNRAAAQLVP